MFVSLLVTVCLNLAVEETCKREIVAGTYVAEDITFHGCLGYQGQISARKFVENHPLYRTWHIKHWSCRWGNKPYEPPAKA